MFPEAETLRAVEKVVAKNRRLSPSPVSYPIEEAWHQNALVPYAIHQTRSTPLDHKPTPSFRRKPESRTPGLEATPAHPRLCSITDSPHQGLSVFGASPRFAVTDKLTSVQSPSKDLP